MSKADMSIWATATVYRVKARPGQACVSQIGKMLIAPPRKIAAQT